MIIIADSGSTKTNWIILDGEQVVGRYKSEGINPVYKSLENIKNVIHSTFDNKINYNKVTEVYFYGAGCMDFENSERIELALNSICSNAQIHVTSDVLAAALSLFNNNKGIGVILGTGANICVFDGKKINLTRSGLGYILGDEGSGAHIGKLLIQDYLNEFIPIKEKKILDLKYNLFKSEIINSIYIKSNANLFFSEFSIFIHENIDKPYYKSLVKRSFVMLFELHITQILDFKKYKLGFVGSVAYYFQDILKEVATEFDIKIDRVIQKPIDGLLDYHLSNN
ncbi:hypothetical protein N9544_07395 [Flavobacteriales bacterium]|nr:hypothetical protein [Flavobacteriales bacterium]